MWRLLGRWGTPQTNTNEPSAPSPAATASRDLFSSLPSDLLAAILAFLPQRYLIRFASLVSKRWRAVALRLVTSYKFVGSPSSYGDNVMFAIETVLSLFPSLTDLTLCTAYFPKSPNSPNPPTLGTLRLPSTLRSLRLIPQRPSPDESHEELYLLLRFCEPLPTLERLHFTLTFDWHNTFPLLQTSLTALSAVIPQLHFEQDQARMPAPLPRLTEVALEYGDGNLQESALQLQSFLSWHASQLTSLSLRNFKHLSHDSHPMLQFNMPRLQTLSIVGDASYLSSLQYKCPLLRSILIDEHALFANRSNPGFSTLWSRITSIECVTPPLLDAVLDQLDQLPAVTSLEKLWLEVSEVWPLNYLAGTKRISLIASLYLLMPEPDLIDMAVTLCTALTKLRIEEPREPDTWARRCLSRPLRLLALESLHLHFIELKDARLYASLITCFATGGKLRKVKICHDGGTVSLQCIADIGNLLVLHREIQEFRFLCPFTPPVFEAARRWEQRSAVRIDLRRLHSTSNCTLS